MMGEGEGGRFPAHPSHCVAADSTSTPPPTLPTTPAMPELPCKAATSVTYLTTSVLCQTALAAATMRPLQGSVSGPVGTPVN